MNELKLNPESYSEHHPEDDIKNNWAAAFANRTVEQHKTAPVLDHPDGSVTEDKLSGSVKGMISEAAEEAHTATETANAAKAVAQSAKASADNAVNEAGNAYDKSLDADSKADNAVLIANTAKAKSEAAEQRAISAETKADAAVASASGAVQKVETAQADLKQHSSGADIHTTAEEKEAWNSKAEQNHAHNEYAKLTDVPSKVSELENDSDYADMRYVYDKTSDVLTYAMNLEDLKANKTNITNSDDTVLSFEFSANHNTENRTGELTTISFTFGDGEYAEDYISGLSFDSGETPTAIDYTDSGILNWVGTDCVTSDGLSIFQPSANTHYDIVFYFNGVQFIGLVNGFVPASGNEAA